MTNYFSATVHLYYMHHIQFLEPVRLFFIEKNDVVFMKIPDVDGLSDMDAVETCIFIHFHSDAQLDSKLIDTDKVYCVNLSETHDDRNQASGKLIESQYDIVDIKTMMTI